MSKRSAFLSVAISIIALLISISSLIAVNRPDPTTQEKDVQYVLYLGTNDKDTNEPVFPPDEALEHAKAILIDHFGGYTIQEANGGWIDGEKVYQEHTLVIYLSDTDIEAIHKACDDMIKEFNQSSVLIQANETTTEFYAGG